LAKKTLFRPKRAQTDVSISLEVPERPQRPQTKKKHDKTMAPVPSTLKRDNHKFGLQTTNLDAIKSGPMLFKAMAAESDEVKTNFLRYAVSMKWCDSPAARAAIARHGPRFAFRFYMG